MAESRKTVIVTGASKGLGKAIALELASLGYNLVLNSRNVEKLNETGKECLALGATVHTIPGDCAQDQIVQFTIKAAKVLGNFQGFIHSAGVLHPGPTLAELSESQFVEIINTNVKSAFLLSKYSIPNLLREGGGFVVFVGSGAATNPVEGWGAYGAAKAAEHYLAAQVAKEAPEIFSIAFGPGAVDTDMQAEGRASSGKISEMFKDFQAKGELHQPKAVAKKLVELIIARPMNQNGEYIRFASLK